jgi:hypothetical protein
MSMMAQDSSHPTGVADDGEERGEQPDKETVRARDRKANAALQLRIAGASWQEVAEVIGFPTPRAALVATERALEKELREESKDAMRQMVGKRLDRLLRGVWKKAIDEESPEQLPAVGKARELIADFRKLHGLDAPTEINVHSPVQGEIEAWVAGVVAQTTPQLEEADIFEVDYEETETFIPDAAEG